LVRRGIPLLVDFLDEEGSSAECVFLPHKNPKKTDLPLLKSRLFPATPERRDLLVLREIPLRYSAYFVLLVRFPLFFFSPCCRRISPS